MNSEKDPTPTRLVLDPIEVASDIRLTQLCAEARVSLAALCAQRLLDEETRLPVNERRQFALSWLPVTGDLWNEVEVAPAQARRKRIERRYKEYLNGPYVEPETEAIAEEADNEAATAAIYATEVYLRCDAKPLQWAVNGLFDWAFRRAVSEYPGPILTQEIHHAAISHSFVQDEVHLVHAAIEIVTTPPWSPVLAKSVHRLLPTV